MKYRIVPHLRRHPFRTVFGLETFSIERKKHWWSKWELLGFANTWNDAMRSLNEFYKRQNKPQ